MRGSCSTITTTSTVLAASELFLATLVRQAPVNVLLTSRDRPAWVSSRDLLYGSVFELSQSALAMTQDEASDVLVDWDRSRASGLIALADGWPAVIGLAGIAPDAAEPDAAPPAELYAYFAEEVLQALGDDVRDGLSVLAIPPVLDAQIANRAARSRAREARVRRGPGRGDPGGPRRPTSTCTRSLFSTSARTGRSAPTARRSTPGDRSVRITPRLGSCRRARSAHPGVGLDGPVFSRMRYLSFWPRPTSGRSRRGSGA